MEENSRVVVEVRRGGGSGEGREGGGGGDGNSLKKGWVRIVIFSFVIILMLRLYEMFIIW